VTDGGEAVYQWTNPQDPAENWSLAVNSHVPEGTEAEPLADSTEVTLNHNVRVAPSEVSALIAKIADPVKRAEAEAAFTTGKEFYLSQAGDDDAVYQWSDKDNSNLSYSVTANDHVPAGQPDASGNYGQFTTEYTFSHSERTSVQEMLALIPLIEDETKRSEAYISLFSADSFYRSQAGNDDAVFQWSSRNDPKVSCTITKNPRLDVTTFSRTKRVSREQVQSELAALTASYNTEKAALAAQIAEASGAEKTAFEAALARLEVESPLRLGRITAALADAKVNMFSKVQAGSDDPVYQWSSASNKNLNYSLSLNTKVPVGETGTAGAGFRTEVTFSRNERASADEARSQVNLIRDSADKAEVLAILNDQLAKGLAVYRSLTDSESVLDYAEYSYQFTDISDPDKSYSLAVNSGALDGAEATWTITQRIGRSQVIAARGYIETTYTTSRTELEALIAQTTDAETLAFLQQSLANLTATYVAKMADLDAAIADGDGFSMSRAGSNDTAAQYQWTSKTTAGIPAI
ncbi:MAG: hypothetical protein HY767_03495, partial [Candidatus Omnitrophica bacterium]|nr:hypothetical protein [Candidatus Omnitrophota bacterium]